MMGVLTPELAAALAARLLLSCPRNDAPATTSRPTTPQLHPRLRRAALRLPPLYV